MEIEKEIAREVALGEQTPPEKICRSESTNQFGEWNERLPDLCFSICRFSQVVFIPQAQPHAQSLFLFPIVFGIQGSSQRSQGVAGRYALTVDVPVPLRLQKRLYAFDVFILLVFSSVRESIASGSQVHETRRAK